MKRTVVVLYASHPSQAMGKTIGVTRTIPKDARVGIFPLHLDPPTVFHQQLFKMLVTGGSWGANAHHQLNHHHQQHTDGSPASASSPCSVVDELEMLLQERRRRELLVDGEHDGHHNRDGTPAQSSPFTSSPTFNASSMTTSPYGEDWDTEALSRFARRRRLLSLLKEYKKRDRNGGSASAGSSVGNRRSSSNMYQNNYVNTNTIRSRAEKDAAERTALIQRLRKDMESSSSAAATSASSSSANTARNNEGSALDPDDLLTEEEIILQLKHYVMASWRWSRDNRASHYGGLATALKDEIFLDSLAFGGSEVQPSDAEKELLVLLQEQHMLTEEQYGSQSRQHPQASKARIASHPSRGHPSIPACGSLSSLFSNFTPYDASQVHSRQLLHKRRLPCQTESEIAEQCRKSLSSSHFAPFDHLIILPNSKYPAPIQQSRHLAAMASLSVRGLHPRIHMELHLLEHPEHNDTAVRDLTNHFHNATIVHWLPNIADVQLWRGYSEMMQKVPMLVLRPKGFQFPSSSGLNAAHAAAASSAVATSAAASPANSSNAPAAAAAGAIGGNRFSHRNSTGAPSTSTADTATVASSSSDSSNDTGTSSDSTASAAAAMAVPPMMDSCAVSTCPTAAINNQLARALKSRLNATELEILEVERLSGAGVRQLLWDRGTRHEEHGVIPPVVLRYMDSHGLYRDFRKGFAQSEQTIASMSGGGGGANGGGGAGGGTKSGKIATASFQATVALASLIPRLEIHFDKNNMNAREQYEKLKNFECKDGQDPDLIVPIGGDGFMMHCIRQNWHRFVPFFGVNAGHRGYLLNEPKRLEELFSYPLKLYHMPMLYCEAEVAVVSHDDDAQFRPDAVSVETARGLMANAMRPSVGTTSNAANGGAGNQQQSSFLMNSGSGGGGGNNEGGSSGRIGFGTSGTMMASSSSPPSSSADGGGNGSGFCSPIIEKAMRENERDTNSARSLTGGGSANGRRGGSRPTVHFETRTELAFNDAWIDRASGQTAWLRVIVNNIEQLKCVRGDGVLVSTAAGSTAYAQALGASPIPADVQLIQLVGSNIVSPSRWRPVHLNQSDSITLEVIDVDKRPCKCFVDSNCLGIAKSLKVRTSRVASVQLAFCHSYDLQQKLYQVQFPKEDDW